MVWIQLLFGQRPIDSCELVARGSVSLQEHMDHVRPTTNLAKKPPQRLTQEKDRTHIRDATPMI